MELRGKDPLVARALALALMRQAYRLLAAAGEGAAAEQQRKAIETLVAGRPATGALGD